MLLSNCLLGGRALVLDAGAISQHLCHFSGSSSLSEPPCPYLDDAGNDNAHLPQKLRMRESVCAESWAFEQGDQPGGTVGPGAAWWGCRGGGGGRGPGDEGRLRTG